MAKLANGAVYEFCLQGHLEERRVRQFDGLTCTPRPDGTTLLVGPVADQAALYGLLSRIRDLGIPLIAVRRRERE